MTIWIDADACPRPAKDLLFKTAKKWKIPLVLVANSAMRIPQSPWISIEIVAKGFDQADDLIEARAETDDLVITADIPLAARIVAKGATGIDPRGLLYTEDNVHARLATRNLLADLRDTGMMGGGPPPYTDKDRAKFASALNQWAQATQKK